MRWRPGVLAALFLSLCLGVTYGVWRGSVDFPTFWQAFIPSLWANIIGVSAGAVIGIPIGFVINNYFLGLAEQRRRRQQVVKVRDLLELVGREVGIHLASLQTLGQVFPPLEVQQTQLKQSTGGTINPASLARLRLQDMFGRQFLADRSSFDIGEALISFEVANYYVRVGELNRLLELRIQQSQQADVWDRSIQTVVQSVWIAQQQVGFEIQQALDRLANATTQ